MQASLQTRTLRKPSIPGRMIMLAIAMETKVTNANAAVVTTARPVEVAGKVGRRWMGVKTKTKVPHPLNVMMILGSVHPRSSADARRLKRAATTKKDDL